VFHIIAWPHCLSRLEGVSPEVYDLWLSKVREARPLYTHGWRTFALIIALPLTGIVGWALLGWRNRARCRPFPADVAAAVPALVALLLLFWQTRTGPAAQMLAVVGAVSLLWFLAPVLYRIRNPVAGVIAVVATALIGFGAVVPLGLKLAPSKTATEREIQINRANRLCNFIGSYRPIAAGAKGWVFTFVDLAPRLITLTHHDSVIGPYHRNGEQIADVMKAFRGDSGQARAILEKYDADYLLTCPEFLDDHDLPGGSARRILRAACRGGGARLARLRSSCPTIHRSGCGGSSAEIRSGGEPRKALLQARRARTGPREPPGSLPICG
jgi:hypothetical protein